MEKDFILWAKRVASKQNRSDNLFWVHAPNERVKKIAMNARGLGRMFEEHPSDKAMFLLLLAAGARA